MLRFALVGIILVQIIIATQSHGLLRSLAELGAFVSTLVLVYNLKPRVRTKRLSGAKQD
ncbi:hypothetical protein [Vibrio sp. JPW-9-11-11]|uniref:hypothetical protein n=1 Tax=Vibrio sp. JPW-9-11-11 TaxID=1416532 RepID=UPI001593F41C|nr:hypothetical protein [Vibrio sp. JPW-9-11-11]